MSSIAVAATLGACAGKSERNGDDPAGDRGGSAVRGGSDSGLGGGTQGGFGGDGSSGTGQSSGGSSRAGGGGAGGGEAGIGGTPGGAAGGGSGTTSGTGVTGGGAGSGAGGGDAGGGASGAGAGGASGAAGCGEYDQRCCVRTATTPSCIHADSICDVVDGGQVCIRCGLPGTPCCAGKACTAGCCVLTTSRDFQCVARGAACPVGGACEMDGSCTNCGTAGKPCCEYPVMVEWCAVDTTTCVRETPEPHLCEPCGELDQLCCQRTEEAFPGATCRSSLRCTSVLEDAGVTLRCRP
jgi:hypothetical protein